MLPTVTLQDLYWTTPELNICSPVSHAAVVNVQVFARKCSNYIILVILLRSHSHIPSLAHRQQQEVRIHALVANQATKKP